MTPPRAPFFNCHFSELVVQTGESHINVTSVTTTFFASQLLWYVATKSHRVHFKLFWSSVDWKSSMWPSLVFTRFICTLWVDSMCFSKYSVLFNVLSQRLHWISHLFLSTCLFKPSALLKTARQFSHLNSSLTHSAMWLFLLLYGILF